MLAPSSSSCVDRARKRSFYFQFSERKIKIETVEDDVVASCKKCPYGRQTRLKNTIWSNFSIPSLSLFFFLLSLLLSHPLSLSFLLSHSFSFSRTTHSDLCICSQFRYNNHPHCLARLCLHTIWTSHSLSLGYSFFAWKEYNVWSLLWFVLLFSISLFLSMKNKLIYLKLTNIQCSSQQFR